MSLFTKIKIHFAAKAIEHVGEDHKQEVAEMPKWLHVVLAIATDVGGTYVAAKYPQYFPLVAAVASAIGVPLTIKAFNTVPIKK